MASCSPSAVERTPKGVIVQIETQDPTQARQVSLEVLGEQLIHVSATPERKFSKKESLVVLPQQTKTDFTVEESTDSVFVRTTKLTASVSRKTGVVHFADANGRLLLAEEDSVPQPTMKDYTDWDNISPTNLIIKVRTRNFSNTIQR